MATKPSYLKVIREEPQYLKIIAANLINRFGDSIDAVAFGWLVYELTGSSEWLAVIMGCNLLPTVLLQPFAGAWVNYLNKKWVMVLCDWGRGALVMMIALLFIVGRLNPVILLVITIANSSLEALRQPCGLSVLPLLVSKENIPVAMPLNQTVSSAAQLIGMGCAGLVITILGVGGAVIVDALTFFASGTILCWLRVPDNRERTQKSFLGELRNGWGYFAGNKALVMVTVICCLLNLIEMPIHNLRPAYINETLRLGTDALSVGSAALSIGMFAGTALYPFVLGGVSGRRVFTYCGILVGFYYFVMVATSWLPAILPKLVVYGLITLCYGAVSSSVNVALGVIMVQNIESEYMARVGGIFNSLACASSPVAALFTAVAIGFLKVDTLYIVMGVLSVVIFAVMARTRAMSALK